MRPIKFRAWDKRNKRMYTVVSIDWSYGEILREYHKNIPAGDWLPEKVRVINGNGKVRTYSYYPSGPTYLRPLRPEGKKHVYSYGDRDLHDLTLLEFTGRKDRNGVEVYESDVLREGKSLAVVEWHEPAEFVAMDITDHGGCNLIPFFDDPSCEVIGNIYETPDRVAAHLPGLEGAAA